jgi:hypothetical protein
MYLFQQIFNFPNIKDRPLLSGLLIKQPIQLKFNSEEKAQLKLKYPHENIPPTREAQIWQFVRYMEDDNDMKGNSENISDKSFIQEVKAIMNLLSRFIPDQSLQKLEEAYNNALMKR